MIFLIKSNILDIVDINTIVFILLIWSDKNNEYIQNLGVMPSEEEVKIFKGGR